VRKGVVDFIRHWASKTPISQQKMLATIGVGSSKFYNWEARYEQKNQHNAMLPKSFWLEEWEREAILVFYDEHPDEGYRLLSYTMLDADWVAVSPSSVYRTLKAAGRLEKWAKQSSSRKGQGFEQPSKPHEHWHIDISYINLAGTFYYLCAILDGYSRYIVHWEIREQMTVKDVEIIMQRAKEKFPEARPRMISDNGPQFISRSFKEFIRISGMTHVRTSPYYPQSNGKQERWFGTLKQECIRPKTPVDLQDSRQVVEAYVEHYNDRRLHSAIGYITPKNKLEGREKLIFSERKIKLEQARKRRIASKKTPQKTLLPIIIGS
jgi:transposase InsO family protein